MYCTINWEVNYPRRKYHWVGWDGMCMLNTMSGLGIMDTKIMNICLMAKWIWKLYAGEQGQV
jgi:hypothetical protein